jgi:hypothetical protein
MGVQKQDTINSKISFKKLVYFYVWVGIHTSLVLLKLLSSHYVQMQDVSLTISYLSWWTLHPFNFHWYLPWARHFSNNQKCGSKWLSSCLQGAAICRQKENDYLNRRAQQVHSKRKYPTRCLKTSGKNMSH